jgi:hypothetical protein
MVSVWSMSIPLSSPGCSDVPRDFVRRLLRPACDNGPRLASPDVSHAIDKEQMAV